MKNYDEENIFNKILKKIVKCVKIHEDQNNLSFEDLNKKAPIHVLTIPKNKYSNFSSFAENASDKEISSFCRSIFNRSAFSLFNTNLCELGVKPLSGNSRFLPPRPL